MCDVAIDSIDRFECKTYGCWQSKESCVLRQKKAGRRHPHAAYYNPYVNCKKRKQGKQIRREVKMTNSKEKICSKRGCGEAAIINDMCRSHYDKDYREKNPKVKGKRKYTKKAKKEVRQVTGAEMVKAGLEADREVSVDFGGYPEIHSKVVAMAKVEVRSIEHQILYIVSKVVEGQPMPKAQ